MRTQNQNATCSNRNCPRITNVRLVPVAGYDSMLLNLSGAHGPYFTRNIAIPTDNAGHAGMGKVPGTSHALYTKVGLESRNDAVAMQ